MRRLLTALAVCVALATWLPEPAAAAAFQFEPRACTNTTDKTVRCGVVRVPENYDKPEGRTIALYVVVLPALAGSQKQVAQFDLEGGPGWEATFATSFYLTDGLSYRRTRDVVLADQRGTGQSAPLRCPKIEAYDLQWPTPPMYPPALVKDCADTLSQNADLTQYTTTNSARDMDAIRAALGYEKIVINALSYGTTLALRYIAQHGEHVQSAILMSTVPAERAPPSHHARSAAHALSLVIADCAADVVCSKAFPALQGDVDTTLAQLDKDGEFARSIFLEKLRALLYTPMNYKHVPLFLHQTASGDFTAFDAMTRAKAGRIFAHGLYLSITCTETYPHIDIAAATAEANDTPFGTYRLERQRAACANWPHGAADTSLYQHPNSDVPVLFLSGAFDPVAPAEWTAALAPTFPNSLHIVVARGAHVLDGLSGMDTCLDAQAVAFIDAASPKAVDPACFAQMRGEPYRTQ